MPGWRCATEWTERVAALLVNDIDAKGANMGTAAFQFLSGGLIAASLSLTACAAAPGRVAPPPTPVESLPTWVGDFTNAFDDSIERLALDSSGALSPDSDQWFGPRAQGADCIAKVKVVSTTTVGLGERQSYLLTLRALERPLAGALPGHDIEVWITPESSFYPMAQVHDLKLTGRTFVGFFKRFNGANGQDIHWFLTGDSRDIREAVDRSRTLSDVGYRQTPSRL